MATASNPAQVSEGSLVAGEYRVLRLLAAGGAGAVYEVAHENTGRRSALKVMHPRFLGDKTLRARFLREVRVTAQIESEFIVKVVDAGVDVATGTPFLVMELLQGEDLGRHLRRRGCLAWCEALSYLHQVAEAVELAHRAGIVHRDLKPSNIFLAQRAGKIVHAKVLDFGIAKILSEDATSATSALVGTPMYMAPEQIEHQPVTPATDVYALGLTAYAILTGEAYWAPDMRRCKDIITFAEIAAQGPRQPASLRAARGHVVLPAGFDGWFALATARAPANRFSSAVAAIRALSSLCEAVVLASAAVEPYALEETASGPEAGGVAGVADRDFMVTIAAGAGRVTSNPTSPVVTTSVPPPRSGSSRQRYVVFGIMVAASILFGWRAATAWISAVAGGDVAVSVRSGVSAGPPPCATSRPTARSQYGSETCDPLEGGTNRHDR